MMDENTSQKQSWAEKPFFERLGIVLGILASVVSIIGGIFFLWDRYGPSEPVDATEVTTVEEITTEAETFKSTMIEIVTEEETTAKIPETTAYITTTTRPWYEDEETYRGFPWDW